MLKDKQREVVAQAGAQIDALQAQIKQANAARGVATNDLRARTKHIVQLESEAAELRRRNDALTSARREAEAGVARFKRPRPMSRLVALMPLMLKGWRRFPRYSSTPRSLVSSGITMRVMAVCSGERERW
jgi:hypothetical protein